MKKILSILMTICLLVSALSVTAFAADPVVLRVSALKRGEDAPVVIGEYTSFQDGWNEAMEIAGDIRTMRKNNYDRIVVDIYTDWVADKDGEFTDEIFNGDGFDNDTIYIPAEAQVTLNLNGHTINRGLTTAEDDGEVIFINDDADVIINDGTIKGGFSNSEGGGLYIEGGANVTLNNVNLVGNAVKGDDGAAIYIYGGATLTMNGGSVRDNTLDEKHLGIDIIEPFGTICAMDSEVILNNVIIDGNYSLTNQAKGVILYAKGSIVKMNQCTVSNNLAKGSVASHAIHVEDSSLTVTNTNFTNNNTVSVPGHSVSLFLFRVKDSDLIVTGGTITQNGGSDIFYFYDSMADIKGVTITDNTAGVMSVNNGNEIVNMAECTLGNNTPEGSIVIMNPSTVTIVDCVLGDTTFSNPAYIKIMTSEVSREEAVIGIDLIRADGTSIIQKYYKDFASGWNYVLECIETLAHDRIVVDLYADVDTREYGVITVPERARVTLNMNGHTIDRGLGDNNQDGGEVICADDNADLIINGGKDGEPFVKPSENTANVPMGKITGGNSDNGAGGIHIRGGARVTLNNVNIVGNTADDDAGAGIAVHDGSVLTMNGGSISNNLLWCSFMSYDYPRGSLYLNESTAYLNGVEFVGNQFAGNYSADGVAIYADDSRLIAENCTFRENGNRDAVTQGREPNSVVCLDDGSMELIRCVFEDNGTPTLTSGAEIVELWGGTMKISESTFRNNRCDFVIECITGALEVSDTVFEGNTRTVFRGKADNGSFFKNCTFTGNSIDSKYKTFNFDEYNALDFENCDFGDSTFNDRSRATFDGAAGVGSIIGEGSLTMIVAILAILALVASVVSISLTVNMKKKFIPATVSGADESDDEDE